MPEDDQKLEYLKRDEVRTMEKDIARLREEEAKVAREKIAQLRSEEELAKEAGKSEQLKEAAQEREGAELEAQRKEEELAILKIKREEKEELLVKEETKIEESEKEAIRKQLREAQLKEEEERKKFLENVAKKAGEKKESAHFWPEPPPIMEKPAPPEPEPPAMETISPPPPPPEPKKPFQFPKVQLPKVPLPKVEGYFPSSPSIFEKIWIRIAASILIAAILATLATFWYWYLAIRDRTPVFVPPAPPPALTAEPTPKKPEVVQRFLDGGYYLPASPRVIDAIIIHSGFNTSNGNPYDLEGVIQSYKKASVATHYLISREGVIYYLAPDNTIAYHAGAGKMPDGRSGVNNFSVGISLIYQENESPAETQYESLAWLINDLQKKYGVAEANILEYKDINPAKTTPWNFNWEKFKLLLGILSFSPGNGAGFFLDQLSLEKRIGQLLIVGFEGTAVTESLENFFRTVKPGGVILFKKNIVNQPQVKKLIQDIQKISETETGLPLFVAIDHEGGVVSRANFFEENTGQAEIDSGGQAYEIGLKKGRELKGLGVNLNLSPVLDQAKPGDFIYERLFQGTPEEIGILAKALISGQKTAGILTAVKHFPGYGGIAFNPEEKLAAVPDAPLIANFRKSMEAGPEFVMTANVIYSAIDALLPLAFSKKGVAFLKEEMGEAPIIITDDLPQKSLLSVFTMREIATMPIKAGADILLFTDGASAIEAVSFIGEAVQKGDISEKMINEATFKIIRLKKDYFND